MTQQVSRQRPLRRARQARQEVKVLVVSEVVAAMVFGGLVPGFLLGLLAFRVKSRWCPHCGQPTQALSQERDR